jgi:predicted MFS family arabinose efflux permease
VTQIGPAVQGLLALIVTMSASFQFWAPATAVFVAVLIFTHTFAFGLLSHLDNTGRAASATPAMAMCGAGLGPVIGGGLGQNFGFGALGITALFISIIAVVIFTKARSAV